MPGYVVTNYKILDRDKINKYSLAARPVVKQYGGEFIVASSVKAIEGSPLEMMVVLKFKSIEAAERWHSSAEYQAIKHMFLGSSAEGWQVIVPEFVMPAE